MARVIFVRTGGTESDPTFSLMDASDVKAVAGQNTIVADVKGERAKRTTLQNKAMQKYWRIICKLLNDSGWTKKKYYEVKEVDIDWTPDSVGDDIWRGIQEAMYGHRSTSRLEPYQVSEVYKTMARHLSNTCGGEVSAEFPNERDYIEQQLRKQ